MAGKDSSEGYNLSFREIVTVYLGVALFAAAGMVGTYFLGLSRTQGDAETVRHEDVNYDGLKDLIIEFENGNPAVFLQEDGGRYRKIEDAKEFEKLCIDRKYDSIESKVNKKE